MMELNIRHPITWDQYNICSLIHDNSIVKIKLELLKLLFEKFDLPLPSVQGRKAPKIALFKELFLQSVET